jgi:hypothetical protein
MSKLEIGKYCDKCSTFLNRLAAPLSSAPLSQLYLDLWRVQSRLFAERSRSENPAQMFIYLVLATLRNRLAAPLASTSLSQLYLDLWRVQSRLLAERSRSDNPAQMPIMAYMYSLKRCDVFSIRAIRRICHFVCIALLDAESVEILAEIGGCYE